MIVSFGERNIVYSTCHIYSIPSLTQILEIGSEDFIRMRLQQFSTFAPSPRQPGSRVVPSAPTTVILVFGQLPRKLHNTGTAKTRAYCDGSISNLCAIWGEQRELLSDVETISRPQIEVSAQVISEHIERNRNMSDLLAMLYGGSPKEEVHEFSASAELTHQRHFYYTRSAAKSYCSADAQREPNLHGQAARRDSGVSAQAVLDIVSF
jgi:hypothetical protein